MSIRDFIPRIYFGSQNTVIYWLGYELVVSNN